MKPFTIFTLIITHLALCLPLHGMDQATKDHRHNKLPHSNVQHSNPLMTSSAQRHQQIEDEPAISPKIDRELEILEGELVEHLLARYKSAPGPLSQEENKYIAIKIKELCNKNLNDGAFLHYAATFADHEFIALLLAHGADKALAYKNKKMPIVIVREKQSQWHPSTKQYNNYQQCIDLLAEPEPESCDDSSL